MLTRSSQIGEFYIMSPPQVKPANAQHTCDMLIYDEESDRHVRITWADALAACCIEGAEKLDGSSVPGQHADGPPDRRDGGTVRPTSAAGTQARQEWANKTGSG